jgi:hypothetical protein
VAALVTTWASQTVVVAKPAANNAVAALMQWLSNHLIGANVRIVEQPDITAIKNARTAKAPAIYSWARGIKQRFKRATFKRIGETDRPAKTSFLSLGPRDTNLLSGHRCSVPISGASMVLK